MLTSFQAKKHIDEQQKKLQEPNPQLIMSGEGTTQNARSKVWLKKDKEDAAQFHLAVKTGHQKEVVEWLERGVSLLSRDEQGFTAIAIANREGKKDIFKLLKQHQQKLNKELWGTLQKDFSEELFEKIKNLLLLGANPEEARSKTDGKNAFHLACLRQPASVVELLLDFNSGLIATLDNRDRSAIWYARKNSDQIVLLIILAKALFTPELQTTAEVINHLKPSTRFELSPRKEHQSDLREMMLHLSLEKQALAKQTKSSQGNVKQTQFQFVPFGHQQYPVVTNKKSPKLPVGSK